jgi:hypothetical protein
MGGKANLKKKKNLAKKYGATFMFGSPGSLSAIDIIFHHIPDIKKIKPMSYMQMWTY